MSKLKPKSKHAQSHPASSLGCGYVAMRGLILILLLLANVYFVRAFFSANLSGLDDRFFQASQFMMPIIMIFIEYRIYDALFSKPRNSDP